MSLLAYHCLARESAKSHIEEKHYRDVSQLVGQIIAGRSFIVNLFAPISLAESCLERMTGLDIDWEELGSEPPNQISRDLALDILRQSFALNVRPNPYTVASAEGGVGVVFRTDRAYSALECLNDGTVWMLWYETGGEPHSKQVMLPGISIQVNLQEIANLHTDA